jgi:hypothetical protein
VYHDSIQIYAIVHLISLTQPVVLDKSRLSMKVDPTFSKDNYNPPTYKIFLAAYIDRKELSSLVV